MPEGGYLAAAAAAARGPNPETTLERRDPSVAPDISDQINDAVTGAYFDPSKMEPEVLDAFGKKLEELVAATDALARQSQARASAAAAPEKKQISLEDLHAHVQIRDAARGPAKDLTVLPTSDAPLTVFAECDDLMVTGDIERVLLGADVAERGYADREARIAALQALRMPLDDAMAKVKEAGVRLRDDFIEFVEMSSVKRVRVCCLSRGLKPLIRQLLRDEGLGHVEVLAHEMYIEKASGAWCVCMRDDSPSGHDKGESMRRALQGAKTTKGKIVLVGRHACDYAPVQAGMVDCLIAPAGSPLTDKATGAGVAHRAFDGWGELQKKMLGM